MALLSDVYVPAPRLSRCTGNSSNHGETSTESSARMTKRPSSDGSGGRFDAFRLARERGRLDGTVDAAALPRVADTVQDSSAPIAWRIEGTQDPLGRPALAVALDGDIVLECQRCLQAQTWSVHTRTVLALARDDADLARLDADSDDEVVLAAAPLDPAQLVEDELVLALPYAPRHADGECEPPQDAAPNEGDRGTVE